VSTVRWTERGLRAAVMADQLDFANFPSRGYRAQADLTLGRRDVGGGDTTDFTRLDSSFTAVKSWGVHTVNLGGRLAYTNQIPLAAIDEYSLGGFQNLSGYRTAQVAGNYLLFGRLTYYQRLAYSVGVARALFVGGSLEAGNAWTDRSDITLRELRGAGSLFVGADTGIGPLYLSLVRAPRGYTGLYLFLGRP